jgi:hypothetical protein
MNALSGLTASPYSDDHGYPEETNTTLGADYQGICPDGWHLPTDYEWDQLERVLAADYTKYSNTSGVTILAPDFSTRSNTFGGKGNGTTVTNARLDWKMKTAKLPSATSCSTDWDGGKSRSSTGNGFNALPAGYWALNPGNNFGKEANFWSSSSANFNSAWMRRLITRTGIEGEGSFRYFRLKYLQFSVRCKKN